ncbi:hypothetical protein DV515_00019061 [Chloebia gouldiae]|uniref:Uncharacterized protein n=1 Tax=Chloebia gouldiae TaxID=44316 RepID=A0A3L8Q5T1_CHLGU|nr:hypothetical protein DV515_00019061 [Chloebia gouldiae]
MDAPSEEGDDDEEQPVAQERPLQIMDAPSEEGDDDEEQLVAQERPLQVRAGLYWSILVYTGSYWFILVQAADAPSEARDDDGDDDDENSLARVQERILQVCTGLYWFVLVYTGPYWIILVHTGPYWFVLIMKIPWEAADDEGDEDEDEESVAQAQERLLQVLMVRAAQALSRRELCRDWEVLGELGRGSFGRVLVARPRQGGQGAPGTPGGTWGDTWGHLRTPGGTPGDTWGDTWGPLGGHLGTPGDTWGYSWGHLGTPGGTWGHLGGAWGYLGAPGHSWESPGPFSPGCPHLCHLSRCVVTCPGVSLAVPGYLTRVT